MAFLFDKVARYKLPRRVILREALPKSGYGKITKKMVREELEAAGLLGERAQS
jgi:fatty-acyl-CoA synthase